MSVPEVWRRVRHPLRPPAARPAAMTRARRPAREARPAVVPFPDVVPTGPARLPVPPLVRDLAGWAWRLLLLGVVASVLLWLAQLLYLVSLPLAASLILAALLSPAVRFCYDRGLSRSLATALTTLAALGVVGGVMTWVVRRAVDSWGALVDQVTVTVQDLPVSNERLLALRDQLVAQLETNRAELTQGVVTGLTTAAEVLTGAVLTLLLTVILLADGERMWLWVVGHFPPTARPRVQAAAGPAWDRLSGWIRGTFIIAVFHAAVIGLSLLVLGVPLVAPLAVLVFFGSFIPIVGAVIFGGLAVLVAFATQGVATGVVLLVVLLVDNQVEAHVLQPFLVGRYVALHPFVVALVITAGGMLWGVPGALLAVPLTAAVHAAVTHLRPVVTDGPTDEPAAS
jgi:putative heme transporter